MPSGVNKSAANTADAIAPRPTYRERVRVSCCKEPLIFSEPAMTLPALEFPEASRRPATGRGRRFEFGGLAASDAPGSACSRRPSAAGATPDKWCRRAHVGKVL